MTRIDFGIAFQKDGYQRTVRYLQRLGAAKVEADELAQEAWTRGWERIWQLRDARKLVGWVNAIARRLLLTSFRRPRFVEFSNQNSERVVAPPINVIEIDMRRAMQACKPHERRSLEAQLDGYSKYEIATQSGKTPAAVHAEAYRARRALREQMHVPPR